MKYVSLARDGDEKKDLLAVSTEDGRVIFYSTTVLQDAEDGDDSTIPHATPVAQVGGKQAGLPGRIKDFEVLSLEEQATEIHNDFLLVTGNSDGVVRVWKVNSKALAPAKKSKSSKEPKETIRQTGKLLTTYETGNRITCLAAFIMLPAEDPSTLFDSADEESGEEEEQSESDEDDE
jgi:protein MAK11